MHQAADVLSQKYKQITEEINICKINFSTTESEIKRISGIELFFLLDATNLFFHTTATS